MSASSGGDGSADVPASRVAWDTERYVASDDAATALAQTRRAGGEARHDDTPALAEFVADRLIDLSFATWSFGDSVAFDALVAASDALGSDRWARFAHGWGRAWATRSKPFVRLDCTAPGLALVELAVRYRDGQLMSACRELADYLMTRRTLDGVYETWDRSPLLMPYSRVELSPHETELVKNPPAGVFVDCLHFDPPFLVALGRATGDDGYVLAGVEQALGYIRLLQVESGLFDHFVLRGETDSFGPGWGRGQGWAILGMLDVVEALAGYSGHLPEDAVGQLRDSASRLVEAMLLLQRDDGHWFAVVTEPGSGDEFSTAGFMASALSRALAAGIVGGDAVIASRRAARGAILSSLDAQGQLREVSAAVYACTAPSHYGHVPRGFVVPWGQGPALLALLATERAA